MSDIPMSTSLSVYSERRLSKVDRVVVWFSAGVTSAVAAKLTVDKYKGILPVNVVYCDTRSEHEDNMRFLGDCEKWIGQPIEILRSAKYQDIWDVFRKERYLVGPTGAKCTTVLKKELRHAYQHADTDIQIFGFDGREKKRADDFRKNNFEVILETPLIDRELSKPDCIALLKQAGVEPPITYAMGYRNGNCIGCPKGGAGYWNKIRKDFPEIFERMSLVEQELNATIVRKQVKGQKQRVRIFLKDLPPDMGRYESEPDIECGVLCSAIMHEIEEKEDCVDL
jgi:3'-phosphoadenosine 5'-phosphosulfate sulfotransferase (PAPS reductase)/FAD synthetase